MCALAGKRHFFTHKGTITACAFLVNSDDRNLRYTFFYILWYKNYKTPKIFNIKFPRFSILLQSYCFLGGICQTLE